MTTAGDNDAQRLTEHDAWAIAMTWREQLQGRVRLEIDSDRSAFCVVDRFEWVTFVFHGAREDGFAEVTEPIDTARCARAASIAWFALSCCSGFSGVENPRFWRRVFSELHAPKGHHVIFRRPRAQLHITDAVRFFDSADHPFPRVCIEPTLRDKDACLRAFLGFAIDTQPDDELSMLDVLLERLGALFSTSHTRRPLSTAELHARRETHSSKLNAILSKLKPFVRSSHWHRRLPVAIRGVDAQDLAWMVPSLTNRPDPYGFAFEQLQLKSVFLRDDESHVETAVRSLLTKTSVSVVLPKLALSRYALSDISRMDSFGDQRLTIGILTPVVPRGTAFTALCASLPHTQTITTVQLDATSRHIATIIGLRAMEWAWLGYAFFHPDAAHTSVFTQLDVDQYRLIDRELAMLKSMAKGNNLHLLLTANEDTTTPEISSYYYQGKLLAGTVVYSTPGDEATRVTTYASETWTTLCITPSQFISLGHWVCTVVPGVGLGWIRHKQISEIQSRPPGPCCLRRLRLNIDSAFGGHGPLFELLSVIGERLEYLHITGRRNPLDAKAVGSILRLCPSLLSLRICHDGSYWSSEDSTDSSVPHLQELELVVGSYQHLPELASLRSPLLNDLQTLRIVTLAKISFVSSNRQTFVDILARFPRLQYANWSLGWSHTGSSPLRSYDDHQAASLTRFAEKREMVDAFVHLPMSHSCRLAFLSVVHAHAMAAMDAPLPVSVLGCFGEDVVATIFAFATTPTRRDLYVDDEVEYVTGHFRN